MAFFKKLFSGKGKGGIKDTAAGLAKEVGLDPKIIMGKIFNKLCGSKTDASGQPAMDFGALMGFIGKTGILKGMASKIPGMSDGSDKDGSGFMGNIFKSVMGGGDQGNDDEGKPKGTLNFDEFQKGMTKVAEKKYEDEGIKGDKALSKLEQQIVADADLEDWGIE